MILSKRDYFAIRILCATISSGSDFSTEEERIATSQSEFVDIAYSFADKMIKKSEAI